MKKIVLAVIATTMLLSNVAFAATKNSTVSSVKQNNVYHLDSQDPYP